MHAVLQGHLLITNFQVIAKAVIPAKAWAYYSSASDDEITIRENRAAYQRYVLYILAPSWAQFTRCQGLVPPTHPTQCEPGRLVAQDPWIQDEPSCLHFGYCPRKIRAS